MDRVTVRLSSPLSASYFSIYSFMCVSLHAHTCTMTGMSKSNNSEESVPGHPHYCVLYSRQVAHSLQAILPPALHLAAGAMAYRCVLPHLDFKRDLRIQTRLSGLLSKCFFINRSISLTLSLKLNKCIYVYFQGNNNIGSQEI